MPGGAPRAFDPYMAVRPDLAGEPLTLFPGVRRQRLEMSPLVRPEDGATALAARHRRLVEPVELAPDGSVHRLQREEDLVAQRQQDAGLDRADGRFDPGLVGRPPRTRGEHDDVVVLSCTINAEVVPDQRVRHWTMAHRRALDCFGGVPERRIIDNLKAGVDKPHSEEPRLNPSFREFAKPRALPQVEQCAVERRRSPADANPARPTAAPVGSNRSG